MKRRSFLNAGADINFKIYNYKIIIVSVYIEM